MATDSRFEYKYAQKDTGLPYQPRDGFQPISFIIRDKKTGVQYLLVAEEGASGLTVLVDKDGKPLIG